MDEDVKEDIDALSLVFIHAWKETLALYKSWELAIWVIQGPPSNHTHLPVPAAKNCPAIQRTQPGLPSPCQAETRKGLGRKKTGEDGRREL